MARAYGIFAAAVASLLIVAGACGGDDDNGGDEPDATATTARTQLSGSNTPAANGDETAEATEADGAVTPATATTPVTGTSPAAGREITDAEAAAVLDSIVLKPADVPGTWNVQADTTTDNAAAAAAEPDQAASIERCGRLLGRTLALMPEDQVTRYIAGEAVAFFTSATVFRTAAGAADCAAEASVRFSDPQELVGAFGNLFVRPLEVVVTPAEFPQVGDGSFAATLSGKINAAGAEVDLTILVVGYLRGNFSVSVGSASAFSPSPDELKAFVDFTLQRVDAVLQ